MLTLAPAAAFKGKENFIQQKRNAGGRRKQPLSSNTAKNPKVLRKHLGKETHGNRAG